MHYRPNVVVRAVITFLPLLLPRRHCGAGRWKPLVGGDSERSGCDCERHDREHAADNGSPASADPFYCCCAVV